MSRRPMDPDGSGAVRRPHSMGGRTDPPEVTFSLNQRQLDIVRARQKRDPSVVEDYLPSSVGDKFGKKLSASGSDVPDLKSMMSRGGGSSVATSQRNMTGMTPIRTPNPVSRSSSRSSSSSDDQQRAFLRSLLQKATSKNSSYAASSSSGGSSSNNKKALVRKVLARSLTTKSPVVSAAKSAKASSSRSAAKFRERMRKASLVTPKDNKGVPRPKPSLSLSISTSSHSPDSQLAPSLETNSDSKPRESSTRRLITQKLQRKAFKNETTSVSKSDSSSSTSDFDAFIKNLEIEASEQHSALWKSFSTVMKGEEVSTGFRVNAKRKKKPFDGHTRKSIQKLNSHLRKNSGLERTGGTELVNDSKYVKEKIQQSDLSSLRMSGSIVTASSDDKSSDAILQMRSSAEESSGSSVITTLTQVVEKQRSTEPLLNRSNPSTIEESRSDDSSKASAGGVEITLGQFESQTKDPEQVISKESLLPPTTPSIMPSQSVTSILTAHSTTQASLATSESAASDLARVSGSGSSIGPPEMRRSKAKASIPTSSRSDGSLPSWSNLQLRSTTSETTCSSSDKNSAPSWASVQLRPIEKKFTDTTVADDETIQESLSDCPSIHPTMSGTSGTSTKPIALDNEPLSILDTLEIEKTFSGCSNKPIVVKSPVFSKMATTSSEVNDHSDSLSENVGAVVFDLKLPFGSSSGTESRVVVGEKVVMLVQEVPGSSEALVQWKLPRQGVSFTLDSDAKEVILMQKGAHETKTLSFNSLDDCKSLTNSLQNNVPTLSPGAVPDADIDDKEDPSVLEIIDVTDVESTAVEADSSQTRVDTDSSLEPAEKLSEEEQALLVKFRQLRQTKTALDALEETISVNTGSHSMKSSTSELTPAEEIIAMKYRRMLKANMSLADVRSQMEEEDVDRNIISLVVCGGGSAPPGVVDTIPDLPSSPVSTMSSTIAPTSSEFDSLSKYKRMKLMGIPDDAVRHKMSQDGASNEMIELLFASAPRDEPVAVGQLSTGEEVIAAKYRKMLKLSIPKDAVRHKMKQDEISENIVAAVLSSTVERKDSLTEEELKVAEKYKKMLSLRIPTPAVRHSMIKDQVDEKIVNFVLGDIEQPGAQVCQNNELEPKPTRQKKKDNLSDEERSVVTQYKKLLKLQIPREQVLARMQREGVSEKIIKTVIGHSNFKRADNDDSSSSKGGSKFVALHWTPLNGSDLENSIWSARSGEDMAQPENSEMSQLIQMFQKKAPSHTAKDKSSDEGPTGLSRAKLLDVTRSNNVAISLKAFKDFTFEQLAEIIAYLDPLKKIRGDRILFLRDLLPTITEVQLVSAYSGSDERLVPAEIWFRKISSIKRIETKVQVMRSMETLQLEARTICENFRTLARAGRQVTDSEKLVALLEMVLSVGNIMNEGTRTGRASGFKFDSLQRLTHTKSSDGKNTVLDFLVTVFVAKGQRSTLDLLSDLVDCQAASRMLISDMTNDVKTMREALDQCSRECEALKVDRDEANGSKSVDSRRGAFSKRDQFLEAIKTTTKPAPIEDAATPSETTNDISGGIERLESFVREGEVILAELQAERDDALETSKKLSKYCGEGGGAGAATTLLGILHQFASNVDSALKKYDRLKLAEEKRQKRKESLQSSKADSQSMSSSSMTPIHSKQDGKSLVLLVNEMLSNATERTKEDFKKGRTTENPSQQMKLIYEKEKSSVSFGSPGTAIRKMETVNAIRQCDGRIDQDQVHQSRSKFARIVDGIESKREADINSTDASEALSKLKYRLFGQSSPQKTRRATIDSSPAGENCNTNVVSSREPSTPDKEIEYHIEQEVSLKPSAVLERAKMIETANRKLGDELSSVHGMTIPSHDKEHHSLGAREDIEKEATFSEQPGTLDLSKPGEREANDKKSFDAETVPSSSDALKSEPESNGTVSITKNPIVEVALTKGSVMSKIKQFNQFHESNPIAGSPFCSPKVSAATCKVSLEANQSLNADKNYGQPQTHSEAPAQVDGTSNENSAPIAEPNAVAATPPRPKVEEEAFMARNVMRSLRSGGSKTGQAGSGNPYEMTREALSQANSNRRKSLSTLAHKGSIAFSPAQQQGMGKIRLSLPGPLESNLIQSASTESDELHIAELKKEKGNTKQADTPERQIPNQSEVPRSGRKSLQQLAREKRNSRCRSTDQSTKPTLEDEKFSDNNESTETSIARSSDKQASHRDIPRPSLASKARKKRNEKKAEK